MEVFMSKSKAKIYCVGLGCKSRKYAFNDTTFIVESKFLPYSSDAPTLGEKLVEYFNNEFAHSTIFAETTILTDEDCSCRKEDYES